MKNHTTPWQLLRLSLLNVAQALGVMAVSYAVPQFSDLYRDFSIDPPAITQAIVQAPKFVFSFLVVLGAAQLILFLILVAKRTHRWRRVARAVGIVNLALIASVFVALYWPVFELGAPV